MAGRIPDQFIDELLARTDLTDVVASRISLKKTGQNYSALCPFHNEKSPSFSLNPNKQFYYCFGCGAGGNAISFVMEHDHLEFVEAIELLAKEAGLDVPREQGAPDRYQQHAALLTQLSECAQYFQQQLLHHSSNIKAKTYLAEQRGLSGQIAKVFGLGYAPPGWDNLLTTLGNQPEIQQLLFQGGMLVEKNAHSGQFYDRFRDRIMFPIRDSRGRVIGFGGRAFGDEKPKYLNSPETVVFQKSQELYGLFEAKQNTPQLEHMIVVEGYMDVIVLAQHGITNAVATLGTSINSQHIKKLFKLVPKITLCFDGDKAGRGAAIRGLEALLGVMQDGKQARFLFLPEGEDPDSFIRKEGKQAFQARLEDSYSLAHVLFDHARSLVTLADEEGEAQFAQNAMAFIQQLPDITLKSVLIKQLEEQSGIDAKHLAATPKRFSRQHDTQHAIINQATESQTPLYDESPFFEPPAEYHDYDFTTTKHHNLNLSRVQQATLCLLLYPQIASAIDVSDPFLRQLDEDIRCFGWVWRYFVRHPNHNVGHIIGRYREAPQIEPILKLLNHPEAHTKSKLINAQQEVEDMLRMQEAKLGLNASSTRLKNKGNDAIKDLESRQELLNWMEQMRKKK